MVRCVGRAAVAASGLHGLLIDTVARRINEIGMRIALGATSSRVTRMVLREASAMVLTFLIVTIFKTECAVRTIWRATASGSMLVLSAKREPGEGYWNLLK